MTDNNKLATKKVSSLLLELAIPAICAQIVTLLYNLVDKIYIGRMDGGALAMAGVGLCAPIVTIINAFTGLFGRGGAPLAAISMGEKNEKDAEKFLGNSFCMLLLSSVIIMVSTIAFMNPLLKLFGASENTLPYARSYLLIYIMGTVFIQLTVGMNYYITTQGFAKQAMITTMMGGILNIILDPIFIFAMNMGIAGAALATVLSQFASFVWVMFFLFGKKTKLRIRLSNMKPDMRILKRVLILGSSPFFMNATEGILHICFNNQVAKFGGDLAVSAMTILFSYMQFLLLPCEGVSQGSQPIVSYNYGAKNFTRVKDTFKLALKVNTAVTLIYSVVVFIFAEFFISIFNSDPELVKLGEKMLRLYLGIGFVHGPNSTFQQFYNSLGAGARSFFFAFLRKCILLIPLLYVFPAVLPWGLMAVIFAEPVSDIITTASNAIYIRYFMKTKLS
ncbi:MAG: MATE family efflux transporter [Clostridia bacterium]|nr:MATE family efflux transporter [Clostridia bacterium]